MAAWHDQQERCADCGHPPEVCENPDADWYPQRRICYPTATRKAIETLYHERHKSRPYHDGTFPADLSQWAEKPSPERPFHYTDGVTIWLSPVDLEPENDWLGLTALADQPVADPGKADDADPGPSSE